MGKSSRDKRDIYYRLAKEEGWRSRSAFKLLQLDSHFNLLKDVSRIVDLCAAPGGWSQVLSRRLKNDANCKILAIDVQQMADIDGVFEIQEDITSQSAVDQVLRYFDSNKSDLVVCDGAPDVWGRMDFDEFVQNQLLLAALKICTQILKPDGSFVAKIFRGKEVSLMAKHLNSFFGEAVIAKPRCCRTSSVESFVVCRKFRPPCDSTNFQAFIDDQTKEYFENSTAERQALPFVSCYSSVHDPDSDMNYPLQIGTSKYVYREPIQKPIDPPYKSVCDMKRLGSQKVARA